MLCTIQYNTGLLAKSTNVVKKSRAGLKVSYFTWPKFSVCTRAKNRSFSNWDLGIVEFVKKLSSGFWKNAKFLGMDQITSKNCIKSSWMQVNNILLTRDRPKQFPSFFVGSFQWNQTTMRWSRVPKAYHFLKILANWAASMLFHCFDDS